jgi:hypothetical protein
MASPDVCYWRSHSLNSEQLEHLLKRSQRSMSVLQVRERNVAGASYLPENSIAKLSIAAQNVNSLFADSTDMKEYVMLAMNAH